MQLTPHFNLEEFTQSDTATRLNIDNTLPDEFKDNAISTCLMLERIRGFLTYQSGREIGIDITSGFRCIKLNVKVGGASTSDHISGNAADIKAPDFGTPLNIARSLALKIDALGIGQMIYEFDSWVHVSTVKPSKEINRILTINHTGTIAGIVE